MFGKENWFSKKIKWKNFHFENLKKKIKQLLASFKNVTMGKSKNK